MGKQFINLTFFTEFEKSYLIFFKQQKFFIEAGMFAFYNLVLFQIKYTNFFYKLVLSYQLSG